MGFRVEDALSSVCVRSGGTVLVENAIRNGGLWAVVVVVVVVVGVVGVGVVGFVEVVECTSGGCIVEVLVSTSNSLNAVLGFCVVNNL